MLLHWFACLRAFLQPTHPEPPYGVTLDPKSPRRPPFVGSRVCLWFVPYHDGDTEWRRLPVSLTKDFRQGVPLYFDVNTKITEIRFAVRELAGFGFADTDSLLIRKTRRYTERKHRKRTRRRTERKMQLISIKYTPLGWGSVDSTLGDALKSNYHRVEQGVVIACKSVRDECSEHTRRTAESVGLDYDKPYSFVIDNLGYGLMNHHHALIFKCPDLTQRSPQCWLKAELCQDEDDINKYVVSELPRDEVPDDESFVPRERCTFSLKQFDVVSAHVVEKHKKYSLLGHNCQYYASKVARLLGVSSTLREQWSTVAQRAVLRRSDADIEARREADRSLPKFRRHRVIDWLWKKYRHYRLRRLFRAHRR